MEAIWDFIANILVALGILFTTLSAIFILISGLVSVYFGRRLFWVFVATLGFMAGLFFSDNVLVYLPPALQPFTEFFRLGFAVLVALVALGLQRFGVVLAGAIAVGILAYYLAGQLDVNPLIRWAAAGIAGLIGAALLWFSHDWMLILITAFSGALIGVVGANLINPLPEGSALWVYLILVITGILFQWRDLGRTKTEAVLVASPADGSKHGVRSRLPFFKKDAEAVTTTPVTLIESAPPAPTAVSKPAPVPAPVATNGNKAATAVAATTVAATTVAAVGASRPVPLQPVPVQPIPAKPTAAPVAAAPVAAPAQISTMAALLTPIPPLNATAAPVAAAPAAATPVAVAPVAAAPKPAPQQTPTAQSAAKPAKASAPKATSLPAAPAPTANVDGQTVVLSTSGGKWLHMPSFKRSQSKDASADMAQSVEATPAPKPFFKSAPEAYG